MLGGSSYWVAFAKTLPFMLLCGIVGPIFLVLYLALDDPATGWLLPWGVIITIGDVVLAALVARTTSGTSSRRSWTPHTQLYGSPQAPPVEAAPALGTPAQRLAELEELMRKDLLSTEEYAASRKRILGEL